jgi:hypothetical protein
LLAFTCVYAVESGLFKGLRAKNKNLRTENGA